MLLLKLVEQAAPFDVWRETTWRNSWTADLFFRSLQVFTWFQDFKCLGSSKVWEILVWWLGPPPSLSVMTTGQPKVCWYATTPPAKLGVRRRFHAVKSRPPSPFFGLVANRLFMMKIEAKQGNKIWNCIAERIWHDSMWYICNIYYIYTEHKIHISTCISKTSTASLFFHEKQINRRSFIEKTLKGQSEKFLCPMLAEGWLRCCCALFCEISDWCCLKNNKLNGLPTNDIVWGLKKFEDAPLYTKGIESQLILQIHQQKRPACRVLIFKITICVAWMRQWCRTSMQPCRIYVELLRKSCERFWWADFG